MLELLRKIIKSPSPKGWEIQTSLCLFRKLWESKGYIFLFYRKAFLFHLTKVGFAFEESIFIFCCFSEYWTIPTNSMVKRSWTPFLTHLKGWSCPVCLPPMEITSPHLHWRCLHNQQILNLTRLFSPNLVPLSVYS